MNYVQCVRMCKRVGSLEGIFGDFMSWHFIASNCKDIASRATIYRWRDKMVKMALVRQHEETGGWMLTGKGVVTSKAIIGFKITPDGAQMLIKDDNHGQA
jgi:hypothetical protein